MIRKIKTIHKHCTIQGEQPKHLPTFLPAAQQGGQQLPQQRRGVVQKQQLPQRPLLDCAPIPVLLNLLGQLLRFDLHSGGETHLKCGGAGVRPLVRKISSPGVAVARRGDRGGERVSGGERESRGGFQHEPDDRQADEVQNPACSGIVLFFVFYFLILGHISRKYLYKMILYFLYLVLQVLQKKTV